MKDILMAALIFSSSIWAGSPAIADRVQSQAEGSGERYFYVVRNNVNLHKSPGMRTGVVARADSGEICRHEYEIGEWILVQFADQRQGFMHVSMLAPYSPGAGAGSVSLGEYAGGFNEQRLPADMSELSTEYEGQSGVWKWAAFGSMLINLVLLFLFGKKMYEEKLNAGDYDKLRELAKIEESKETLKRELYLAVRQNKRLEDQIARLRGDSHKK